MNSIGIAKAEFSKKTTAGYTIIFDLKKEVNFDPKLWCTGENDIGPAKAAIKLHWCR
jgi:hypothetical protein